MHGAMMTKRKNVTAREPNGRPQRVNLPPSSEVKRLRDAALSGMRDPMWGTELGRLHLVGKIDARQFAAGKHWGELASKYSQAMQGPCPDPKAVNFDRGAGGQQIDPDSHEGRKEARRHARSVQSFIDAHVALKATSVASERLVRLVCERNEMLAGYGDFMALSCGLITLADFWGLTGSSKSPSDRHS